MKAYGGEGEGGGVNDNDNCEFQHNTPILLSFKLIINTGFY
jgi:hypothetical protein